MRYRSIANAMRRGDEVPPKLFTDASVFFCDIVNFQMMAMESQPLDIVKLLNDIYLKFDEVIARFKVYKVPVTSPISTHAHSLGSSFNHGPLSCFSVVVVMG